MLKKHCILGTLCFILLEVSISVPGLQAKYKELIGTSTYFAMKFSVALSQKTVFHISRSLSVSFSLSFISRLELVIGFL